LKIESELFASQFVIILLAGQTSAYCTMGILSILVASLAFSGFNAAPTTAWTTRSNVHRRNTRHLAAPIILSATVNNNNVVLSPSADPSRFDSFRLGSPRVHRYTRDLQQQSADSETEYVMWYHGRSVDLQASEPSLPPLSTGRIGRATSRNGLAWIKDESGSVSEDAPDVSLGLNKESWWGFDTAHIGLGNVLLPMSTPAVLSDAGVYLMYYHGGSHEETSTNDASNDTGAKTLKGLTMKVGVAISQDGISWGRVEGDDPTGACLVPFDKSDPNQRHDQSNSNIEEELYCGWPEVVLDTKASDESRAFLMYYSTMTKDGKVKCIAQATSPDGFRWLKSGICIRPSLAGADGAGCARCCVLRDSEYDSNLGVWKELDSWTMLYEGISAEDGKHRILSAKSRDGLQWTKQGVALDPREEAGAWDCAGVGSPHVLR